MKQHITTSIVLRRTNYGEADRILTILTPNMGKLRVIAKGVRRVNAKLAGGTELFSVSSITFLEGKADLGILISARLDKHYGQIAKDIDRTMLGYDLIKEIDRITEDQAEGTWFELLNQALSSLDNPEIGLSIIRFWFQAHTLLISGYSPNLQTDSEDRALDSDAHYSFSEPKMSFVPDNHGKIGADQIKFLRLGFSDHSPMTLQRVANAEELVNDCSGLLQSMLQVSLRA